MTKRKPVDALEVRLVTAASAKSFILPATQADLIAQAFIEKTLGRNAEARLLMIEALASPLEPHVVRLLQPLCDVVEVAICDIKDWDWRVRTWMPQRCSVRVVEKPLDVGFRVSRSSEEDSMNGQVEEQVQNSENETERTGPGEGDMS